MASLAFRASYSLDSRLKLTVDGMGVKFQSIGASDGRKSKIAANVTSAASEILSFNVKQNCLQDALERVENPFERAQPARWSVLDWLPKHSPSKPAETPPVASTRDET